MVTTDVVDGLHTPDEFLGGGVVVSAGLCVLVSGQDVRGHFEVYVFEGFGPDLNHAKFADEFTSVQVVMVVDIVIRETPNRCQPVDATTRSQKGVREMIHLETICREG